MPNCKGIWLPAKSSDNEGNSISAAKTFATQNCTMHSKEKEL